MTIFLPLEHNGEISILRISDYDNYCMVYDYFFKEYKYKKLAGRRTFGWQIATGKIPLVNKAGRNVGFLT